MRFHGKLFFGSVLLILSLFLPLSWHFIPEDLTWFFPFYDKTCKCFSFVPIEYAHYKLYDVIPLYCPFVMLPMCLLAKDLIPEMAVKVSSVKINIYYFHVAYYALCAIDLFMSFSQAHYFRTSFILVGCYLQVKHYTDNQPYF